jgi:plastocyanin
VDGTIYFYAGGALVLCALVFSFIGIRGKKTFPPSGSVMAGVAALFAVLVVGTAAYAVANAREEVEHREHEEAEEGSEAAEEVAAEQEGSEEAGAAPAAQEAGGVSEGGQPPGAEPGGGEAQSFDITSPEDGSLVYEPDSIDAAAGTITLAYANPSPVPHNINLEVEGETIAESEDVTGAETSIEQELAPGQYVFYCSIPGHRESGMEGTLTVE